MGYKRIGKKILAIILSVTMIVSGSVLVKNFWKKVSAAEYEVMPGAKPNVTAFATRTELMSVFDMDGNSDTVGKIKFGKNSEGNPMEWYILGDDTGVSENDIILFSAGPIKTGVRFYPSQMGTLIDTTLWTDCVYPYGYEIPTVYGHHYGASETRDILQDIATDVNYFTLSEQALMKIVPITMYDDKNSVNYSVSDYLYTLAGENGGSILWAGVNSQKKINIGMYLEGSGFWLRSYENGSSFFALYATPEYDTISSGVISMSKDLRPATTISANDVLFASSATATSEGIITAGTAMSLRLDGSSMDIGEVVYDASSGFVYAKKDDNATGDVTLIVQGNDGTNDWYYSKMITGESFVNVSEIEDSVGVSNVSLADCEIWIEKTDDGMIYANPATEGIIVSRIELTINTPVGNEPFDTSVSCNSRGINSVSMNWTDCDGNDVTGNANFYPWEYVAVFEITPEADVIFVNNFDVVINNGEIDIDECNTDANGIIHVKTWGIPSTIANITHIDTPMTPEDGVFDNFYFADEALFSSELADSTGVILDGVLQDYVSVTWSIDGEYDETPNAVNTFCWTANIDYSNRAVAEGVATTGTVNIRNRDFLVFDYDAEGYSGTYDDEEHGITISGNNIDDADITYSLDGTIFDSVYPVFKDVGEYTVYYRIEQDLYTTVTGSATVRISKTPVTITPEDQTVEYGVAIADDLYEVSGLLPGHVIGSLTLVQSTTDVTASGTITVSDVVILDGLGADVTDNYVITSLNGALVIEATDVVDYEITEGEDSEWNGDLSEGTEDLTIKTDGDYEKFIGVKINGEFVEEAECVEDRDKTTVVLPAEFLGILDSGEHVIEIVWMDGSVSTNLVISNSSDNDETPSNGSTEGSTEGSEEESEDTSEEDASEDGSAAGGNNSEGSDTDDIGAGDGARMELYIGIILMCGVAALAVLKRKVNIED